ncbi:MAG: GTP-binding protein, partial [Pseudomonadota bacterium]|nr:GTP-binding protein [Pseudomonadota bacterium]
AAWNKLLRNYLRGRMNLRRVFVLIDARHGIKSNDMDILNLLDEAAVSYQIVLTKADKPKEAALAATLETMQTALVKRPAAHPEMITTSAVKGHGINLLQAEIAGLVDLSAIGYKA